MINDEKIKNYCYLLSLHHPYISIIFAHLHLLVVCLSILGVATPVSRDTVVEALDLRGYRWGNPFIVLSFGELLGELFLP